MKSFYDDKEHYLHDEESDAVISDISDTLDKLFEKYSGIFSVRELSHIIVAEALSKEVFTILMKDD